MAEWLNAHAWKACLGLYPNEGSNPSLSATFSMGAGLFMESNSEKLLRSTSQKIQKAFSAFEKSLSRVATMEADPECLTDDQLEHWEAYCSRFSRLQDMIVKRYFRLLAVSNDPAWSGSVRDLFNVMEKDRVIDSAASWMQLRELRNARAHEYEESELKHVHIKVRDAAPTILKLKPLVNSHAA
jgi:hypothetical protein